MTLELPHPTAPIVVHCPPCDKPVIAHSKGRALEPDTDMWGPGDLVTLAQCSECGCAMVVTQSDDLEGRWSDPVRVYPPTSDQLSLMVPSKLRDECEEARHCFTAKAYTATAVMVRRVLEGLCLDQGATAKPLINALKQLADDGKLDGRLLEWAQELRGLGNQGAHHTGAPVQKQDAHDALLLAEEILNYVYALPIQFEAFRRRRAGEPPLLPPPLANVPVEQTPPPEVTPVGDAASG
ncbi:protein of unknown function [Streptomyces sp. 1222.2]|uniref:DUF4145 domain-containing protein n=1 Tax=Streptomyces sp. 1222.2 TaxID=1938833 RepID=UPI000BCCABCC|nr:DUF4145 domain-containing protein [Streptomyces sp. 1222.2]SOD70173.1 protein of unknown function [Streptomyces sp. 1222.2]